MKSFLKVYLLKIFLYKLKSMKNEKDIDFNKAKAIKAKIALLNQHAIQKSFFFMKLLNLYTMRDIYVILLQCKDYVTNLIIYYS